MRFSHLLTAACICGALSAGCSSEPEPNDPSQYDPAYGAQPGYGQPGYGQQPQPGYGQPAPQPTAPAPAPTAAATGGGDATPLPPAAAAVATPMLQGLAQNEMRGMQPDGGAFAGQFQQGQKMEQPFQLQPGRCYGVVGVGIGITELDVQIVMHQPPLPPATLAQDQGTGPQAVLGGSGQCFKNPLPVGGPAKVIMTATGGSGIAMAQIFSK